MVDDEDEGALAVVGWPNGSDEGGLVFSLFSCDEMAVSDESAPSARSEEGSWVRKRGDVGRAGGGGGGGGM